MRFLQYLDMDYNSWINTGVNPGPESKIFAKLCPMHAGTDADWATFWGSNTTDDNTNTYQLRQQGLDEVWKAQIGTSWSKNPGGDLAFVTGGSVVYETIMDVPNRVFIVNNVEWPASKFGWNSFSNNTISLYVGANNKNNTAYRASAARWYEFKVWNGANLIIDLLPVIDDNQVVCFYDEVSHQFVYNEGTGTFTAGPVVSSVQVWPLSKNVKSDANQFQVDVTCDNAWTAVPTDGSWYTLSETGGTGSTAITISVNANSASTAREDTIVFTDLVTLDNSVFTLKQKKYVSGQPFYLGNNEVTEVYLGDNAINEAYLGNILVFSTGPFVGLKVTPKTVNFAATTLSATIRIKSSEAWSMTLPAWISASQTTGDTGTTSVTLTTTPQTGATADTITVSTANFSASATANYLIYEPLSYVYATSHSSYVQANHIDTGIAHTASTMTVEIEYYGFGGNCDRMVGYSQGDEGCTSDSNDFRLFGFSNGTFDYLSNRQSTGTINTGYRHLTIGDCFCYDNAEERYRTQRTAFETVPSPNCRILVDVSYIKVKSVKIMNGNTLLFDGVAAKVGNDIGIFDKVSGQLKYNSNVPMSYDE